MRWLLERGADVHARDKRGNTPSQLAKQQEIIGQPSDYRAKSVNWYPLVDFTMYLQYRSICVVLHETGAGIGAQVALPSSLLQ